MNQIGMGNNISEKDHSGFFQLGQKKPGQKEKYSDYDKESKEFYEAKEGGLDIELRGFEMVEDGRTEIINLREKLKNESETLSELQKEEIRRKLVKLEAEAPPLDSEQMKVFLGDIFKGLDSPELRKFVQKNCIFELQRGQVGGITVDSQATPGKFTLFLDTKSFYHDAKTEFTDQYGVKQRLRYFNPAKVAFFIGKAIGSIIETPKGWQESAPKVKMLSGGEIGDWTDFVGFCLSTPHKAEEIFPNGYKFFKDKLGGLAKTAINPEKHKDKKKIQEADFILDLRTGEEKGDGPFGGLEPKEYLKGFSGLLRRFMANTRIIPETGEKIFTGLLKRVGFAHIDAVGINWPMLAERLWRKTDWYQRAIAEHEDKEVSRIMTRNEGIVDRDRALRQLVGNGKDNIHMEDEYKLRTILMADMKFQDFSAERMHVYLQATDEIYRHSHGEQITEESYNFLVRLQRVSNAGKRWGTKPTEYKRIEPGEDYTYFDKEKNMLLKKTASKRIFVRRSQGNWMFGGMLYEIKNKTNREVANVAQEAFEYMKIGDRFIGVDERWENSDKYGEKNIYSCPTGAGEGTGDWRTFLGQGFADNMFENINHREKVRKLNPDQIAIIARIIAEELKAENESITGEVTGAKGRAILSGTEHVKGIMLDAYRFYKEQFLESDELRGYVNYYLESIGLSVDSKGSLDRHEIAGKSDEDFIEEFGIQQYGKNPCYKEAHKISQDYGDFRQDEKPGWKKENGKFVDDTENELKQEFIYKRKESKAAGDIATLNEAANGYVKIITNKVNNSTLSSIGKKTVLEKLINDPELKNTEFILEDVESALRNDDPESFSTEAGEERALETISNLQKLIVGIRPFRRELIKIQKFLGAIGAQDQIENFRRKIKDVKLEDKRKALSPEKQKDLEREAEEMSDEEKKEGKREPIRIDIEYSRLPLEVISQLMEKIKRNELSDEEIYEEIDKLRFVPVEDVQACKDPSGKLHKEKVLELLRISRLAIESRIARSYRKLAILDEKQKKAKKK